MVLERILVNSSPRNCFINESRAPVTIWSNRVSSAGMVLYEGIIHTSTRSRTASFSNTTNCAFSCARSRSSAQAAIRNPEQLRAYASTTSTAHSQARDALSTSSTRAASHAQMPAAKTATTLLLMFASAARHSLRATSLSSRGMKALFAVSHVGVDGEKIRSPLNTTPRTPKNCE